MATLIAPIIGIINSGLNQYYREKAKIGELFIDASYVEIIDFSSDITSHPVETGSSISDHVYLNPIKIKFEGAILDSSTDIISTIQNTASLFSGNILDNIYGKSRKQLAAYEFLKDTYYNKTPVTIVSYYDTFENMVIENMTFPRNGETGDQLYFEITLKQITLTDVAFVSLSRATKNVQDMLQKKTNLGRQETIEASEQVKKKTKSILAIASDGGKSIWTGVKKWFGF
jgi:hypothetical protein